MRLLHMKALAAATLVLGLSACSTATRSLPPLSNEAGAISAGNAGGISSMSKAYGVIRFRIAVPGRTHSSGAHRALPAYVSSATRKAVVTVQGADQKTAATEKFKCTAVCSGKIVAPLGVDAVAIALEDKKNRVLSRGTATVVVFKTSGNIFDFTLDGVPASVALVPESNVIPVVPASSGYVNFDARDADGRIITPDGHYTDANGNPLVFDLKSSSTSFRLGTKTESAPGAPIPFYYNGTQHVGTVTLTAKAARGVHTTVTFHPSALTFVPGISKRMQPPMQVQILGTTQVPMSGSSTGCSGSPCHDPNGLFLLGNSGGQQVALVFNVATGSYTLDNFNAGEGGPFVFAPVDLGGNGFYGYFSGGSGAYGVYEVIGFSASYGGTANPCPTSYNVPIGRDSSALYCSTFVGPVVYDATHSTFPALGYERKIRVINGVTYIATANSATPSQQVYTGGSQVSGATTVGANVTIATTGYYGDADGTVKAVAGSTVATFSNAVEAVVGYGSSIYAYENGGIFGVSNTSGRFETAALPIGNVVEVVTGVNGAPMLVEADGTLDVMGI